MNKARHHIAHIARMACAVLLCGALVLGAVLFTRRTGGSSSDLYTSGGFAYLRYCLEKSQSELDVVGVSGSECFISCPDESLYYDRLFRTLSFHRAGERQWTEYLVSEEELRAAAQRRILPKNFPRLRDPQARLWAGGKLVFALLMTLGTVLLTVGLMRGHRP